MFFRRGIFFLLHICPYCIPKVICFPACNKGVCAYLNWFRVKICGVSQKWHSGGHFAIFQPVSVALGPDSNVTYTFLACWVVSFALLAWGGGSCDIFCTNALVFFLRYYFTFSAIFCTVVEWHGHQEIKVYKHIKNGPVARRYWFNPMPSTFCDLLWQDVLYSYNVL